MLRPPLLLFFLLFAICSSYAQEPAVTFGKITFEDFKVINTLDSGASAIVLYEKGVTDDNKFTYHIRIKILKSDGVKWGSVRLQYRSHSGEAKVEGATYNLDHDSIVTSKLETQSIFKLREIKHPAQLNFALPNVKVGSIIEYQYEISVPLYINWVFQKSIPVLWSEYIRAFSISRNVVRGDIPVTIYNNNYNGNERWVIANIPSFKEEPNMFDPKDNLSRLEFLDWDKSWVNLNRSLLNYPGFGSIINGGYIDDNLVKQIISGTNYAIVKVKFIVNYIKHNIVWNGQEDFLADLPIDILTRKYGSSGDINLMLIGMLRKAGVKAEPVLLSTRGNGIVHKEITDLEQFNYVICQATIDTTKVLLDATEKLLPYNVLPTACLNYIGMVVNVKEEKGQWITIDYKAKKKTTTDATMSLKDDGTFEGQLVSIREGYDAFSARKSISKGEAEFFKNELKGKTWQVSKTDVEGLNDINIPLKITYNLSAPDHSSASKNLLYFNPFFNLAEETNPFLEQERKYPIDFGVPIEKVYLSNITIPDGYTIEHLPEKKAFILQTGFGKYFYNVSVVGNRISISSKFSITKTVFLPAEYPFLRELYSVYIAKQSEQIVLVRH
jgi:hypothetical protein